MKAKLLKKIRHRFSIEYFPHRSPEKRYVLIDQRDSDGHIAWMMDLKYANPTKQACLDIILLICRGYFFKYSRKHKLKQISKKVWYEGNT